MNPKVLEFKGETNDPYVFWIGKGEPGQYVGLRFYSRNSTCPNRISAYVFNRSGGLGAAPCRRAAATKRMDSHCCRFRSRLQKLSESGRFRFTKTAFFAAATPRKKVTLQQLRHRSASRECSVRLGTRNFTSFFAGSLDEFAIYPRVLERDRDHGSLSHSSGDERNDWCFGRAG